MIRHGVRTELRYDEMNALDKAIDQYSKAAEEYYKIERESSNLPPDIRKKREAELATAKRFLEHQRMNAENYASIQAQLDTYREQGRAATQGPRSEIADKQRALLEEKHHPTELLAKLMAADGKPRPSKQHTAHHVSPGKGKSKAANLARVHMHRFGIRVNDPDNGVWLPTYKKYTPHWSMPDAKGHLEYHTIGYESWVTQKIRARRDESLIRMELNLIGDLLKANNLPQEARKK